MESDGRAKKIVPMVKDIVKDYPGLYGWDFNTLFWWDNQKFEGTEHSEISERGVQKRRP
jgi:hypothetical protein